jgi:hypothetical protein
VWRRPHITASWLLRRVFETATDYEMARAMLRDTPIAAGAIYSLVGPAPGQACVIERRPEEARVIDGPAAAANAWQAAGWRGRPRGEANDERHAALHRADVPLDGAFDWLCPPVLNETTRLAFVADPASGAFVAQGWEADGPATATLEAAA